MRIKYNRTSTHQQLGSRFDEDSESYDLILFDQVSGLVPFSERSEAKKLLDLVDRDLVKTVVFEEMSRIGRNTIDTLKVLELLDSKQVNVIIRNMGLQSRPIDGQKNPIWDIITSILSSMSQLELENIRTRISQGRAIAKLQGRRFGRPVGSTENEKTFLEKNKNKEIVKFLKKGRSVREVAKLVGASTKTVVKVNKLLEKYRKLSVSYE